MAKYKKAKIQKATKTRSMLGGSAAKVEVHPELKRTSRGAPLASIHEDQEFRELEAVVVFGRMNPPTIGHQRLVEGACVTAAAHEESTGDTWQSVPVIVLSKTLNEDNPLPYKRRVELARQAFPDAYVFEEDEVKDYLSLVKFIAEHFDNATFLVGSDRFADLNRIIETYNGKDFTFESCSVQWLDRDPDSDKIEESVSASQLRMLAESEDIETFKEGLPDLLKSQAAQLMSEVKEGVERQRYLKEESGLRKVAKATIINRNK